VLGEAELETSAVFAELLVRAFVRGTPALPAAGMAALPEQLAARLSGTLILNTRVTTVESGMVHTDQGTVEARAVLVATDPCAATGLLGLPQPVMRGLTTFYFLAPEPLTVAGHW
jgi:phytoene dehydrogenase-like protein